MSTRRKLSAPPITRFFFKKEVNKLGLISMNIGMHIIQGQWNRQWLPDNVCYMMLENPAAVISEVLISQNFPHFPWIINYFTVSAYTYNACDITVIHLNLNLPSKNSSTTVTGSVLKWTQIQLASNNYQIDHYVHIKQPSNESCRPLHRRMQQLTLFSPSSDYVILWLRMNQVVMLKDGQGHKPSELHSVVIPGTSED